MDIHVEKEIEMIEESRSFFLKTFQCSETRATQLALKRHFDNYTQHPTYLKWKAEILKHYNL